MTKRKSDILAGLVSILVAVAFMVQGFKLSDRVNAMPLVLEIFLIVTGIYMLIRGFISKGAEKGEEGEADINWVRAMVIVLATFVYVAGVIYIGFYVSTFVYLLLGSWYLNEKGLTLSALMLSLIFSTAISGVLYLIFTVLLLVPTPAGLFF